MLYNNTNGCVKCCFKGGTRGPRGKQGPRGEQGQQGPSGETLNALLFYNDISLNDSNVDSTISNTDPIFSDLSLNSTYTSDYGISRFLDDNNYITFENETLTSTSFVEIYSHCDALAGSAGTSNFLSIFMECTDPSDNTLQIIDIDTRSVEKGDEAHLSFGPSAYKVENDPTGILLTIKKDSKYKLRVEAGRNYNLSEIKLIIKFRN